MAERRGAGGWGAQLPRIRQSPGRGDLTDPFKRLPALCAGRLVRGSGEATPAWAGFPYPVRGRLRRGLRLRGGRPSGDGGSAEAFREVRLDASPGEDSAGAVPTTTSVADDGIDASTGNVRFPRVYPLLGTHAEGELGRQASDRSESLSSRRQEGGRMVPCQPSPTDHGTARSTESEVERALWLLWHHRELSFPGPIPSGRRSTLAEMAVSPLVGGPPDLGSIQPLVRAVPAPDSGIGSLSVPLRSKPMT